MKNMIVFEGLDGSGKSLQTKMLVDRFHNTGIGACLDAEPTHSDIGFLIRKTLQGKSDVNGDALAWLFAANRYEHLYGDNGIKARTALGEVVVCDRYVMSSYAYQGSYVSDLSLIHRLNDNFPQPQLLIFLNVSVDVALSRIQKRDDMPEMFDKRSSLEKIQDRYQEELATYDGAKLIIDADRSIDEIADEIWDKTLEALAI